MKKTLTLIFFFCSSILFGQTSPFKAGIAAGLNFSQVDGDYQHGYHKKGLTLGIRGGIVLKKKYSIITELLYNYYGGEPRSLKELKEVVIILKLK